MGGEGCDEGGVYIPRRDTSLKLNALVGGKLFPGKHFLAKFDVEEGGGRYKVAFTSSDNTSIAIDAEETDQFDASSIFETLDDVSSFFERGAVGYSPNGSKYEGLKLEAYSWQVKPLRVLQVRSSFYENKTLFPDGSIQFDNALLMSKVEHEWRGMANKRMVIAAL